MLPASKIISSETSAMTGRKRDKRGLCCSNTLKKRLLNIQLKGFFKNSADDTHKNFIVTVSELVANILLEHKN